MKRVFTLRAFIKSCASNGYSPSQIRRFCEYSWVQASIGLTREEMRFKGLGTDSDWFEDVTLDRFTTFLKSLEKGVSNEMS